MVIYSSSALLTMMAQLTLTEILLKHTGITERQILVIASATVRCVCVCYSLIMYNCLSVCFKIRVISLKASSGISPK